MKKKSFFLILNKKNNYLFGAFPRTKEGKAEALLYKEKLKEENKGLVFIIK
jgi:hypothetical protein